MHNTDTAGQYGDIVRLELHPRLAGRVRLMLFVLPVPVWLMLFEQRKATGAVEQYAIHNARYMRRLNKLRLTQMFSILIRRCCALTHASITIGATCWRGSVSHGL